MKTRTIKELLIILRDNEDIFKKECFGLCGLAWLLHDTCFIITYKEYSKIMDYFNANLPAKKYQFDEILLSMPGSCFCWKLGEWNPRLKWLNKQINSLN
jgi:hypothetical protein